MGIGISVFLIAIGAILAWAVEVTTEGVDLNMVGVILMVVGLAGLLFTMLFWSSFAPWGRREERLVSRGDPAVRDGYVRREERVVRSDDYVA